jgi:cytochrome c556
MLGNNTNTNTNTGFFNRPFGLNVQVPTRTFQQAKETATKAVSNLWEPVVDYFEKADNVFSGDVQNQIQKYYSMAYSLGQTVRKGEEKHTFNATV